MIVFYLLWRVELLSFHDLWSKYLIFRHPDYEMQNWKCHCVMFMMYLSLRNEKLQKCSSPFFLIHLQHNVKSQQHCLIKHSNKKWMYIRHFLPSFVDMACTVLAIILISKILHIKILQNPIMYLFISLYVCGISALFAIYEISYCMMLCAAKMLSGFPEACMRFFAYVPREFATETKMILKIGTFWSFWPYVIDPDQITTEICFIKNWLLPSQLQF